MYACINSLLFENLFVSVEHHGSKRPPGKLATEIAISGHLATGLQLSEH